MRNKRRLSRQRECAQVKLCAEQRRGVLRRLLAKMRRRGGVPAEWRGPDFGGGDPTGVREPRRPKPSAGSAAMALEVPRST